jgi:glutathione S-transferase
MFRLHGFCQSGNTFKVAFALRAMGVPFETVLVDFMNGRTRDPTWRAEVNPMGEVPVLDDGEQRMTQSGAILVHLATRFGRFGGDGESQRQDVLRWLFFDNHKFTSYFATYRFMKAFAPQPPDPVVAAWLRPRIDSAFAIADRHLATSAFIVGNAPTIADFSMSAYLFYPEEESGYTIAPRYPHIAGWLDRLRAVDGWADPYECLPGDRITPRW